MERVSKPSIAAYNLQSIPTYFNSSECPWSKIHVDAEAYFTMEDLFQLEQAGTEALSFHKVPF